MTARAGLLVLLGLAAAAAAQESPEEQARRLLEDGRTYLAQGKLKQALDNFDIIVQSFSRTEVVGQALLEIGRYRKAVEGDAEKARAAFEQVAKEHPRSEAAPGAYFELGLLTLDRAVTAAELDDALAQFARVETLYPHSEWVPPALQASAVAHRRGGRLQEAVDLSRRVSLEYPASAAAAAAQFEAGQALALLGEPRPAMEEFQQVRNRFPESPWAPRALDRLTALYRLHGGPRPAFALDPAFAPVAGTILKEVCALAVAPDGTLWVASEKSRSAVPLDASGKPGAGFSAEHPQALSIGPRGEIVFAARTAVRIGPRDVRGFSIPADKPGEPPEPLERILAAAVTPGGWILVSDERRERVFRFSATGEFRGTFPERDAARRKVIRIVVDGEGGIVLLDREERIVRVHDEAGRPLRAVGPAGLRKPVDVAVDAFRNTYVVDEEAGVQVFGAQGQPLTTITSPELRRPRALALDAAGAVLVYDEKAERLLRYR